MDNLDKLLLLLKKLDEKKIYYRLNKVRDYTIMVDVIVPGQRWEIEYNTYGENFNCVVEIEKFISNGTIYDEKELENLFREFSD